MAWGESRHAIDASRLYGPHRATYIDYLNYVWQALAIAGLQDRTYNAPPGAGLDTGEQVLKTRLKLPDYTGSWLEELLGEHWYFGRVHPGLPRRRRNCGCAAPLALATTGIILS